MTRFGWVTLVDASIVFVVAGISAMALTEWLMRGM